MQFIAHRINSCDLLAGVPENYGVEIDVRDFQSELVLHHDPFCNGELLEKFLTAYRHKTLILNIKSEGIEWRVRELLQKYNISDYFFLDSSFPMIVKLFAQGETKTCIRVSEYESIETALNMQDRASWVWVDCFNGQHLDKYSCQLLRDAAYKICLVSPVLLGRQDEINQFGESLLEQGIKPDAICCKLQNARFWQDLF